MNIMIESKLVVEELKKEAETHPASKAALMVFCLRKRPRTTLTLIGLEHKMQREGFTYNKSEFLPLLTAMNSVGIGEFTKDSKGKIVGLEGINVTFKSLGEAVFDDKKQIETFKL